MRWHRHLALLLLAGIGSALLLAFPWLASRLPAVGIAIAVFFSQLCHQNPSRSFVLAGATLPVCARCLALYVGGFLGIAIYPALGLHWRQFQKVAKFLIASLFLIVMDVGLDMAGLWKNTFVSRSLTGALFGVTCGLVLSWAVQHSGRHHSQERQPSIPQTSIPPST